MGNVRYDISRLRKKLGLNQKEMAERLGFRQSFLSSVENGKSPFPADRLALLEKMCEPESLKSYIIEETPAPSAGASVFPPGSKEMNMLSEVLNYFHSQAHREQDGHHEQMHKDMEALQQRNDRLAEKNEALQEKIDILNATIERLREELHQAKGETLELKARILKIRTGK